MLSPHSNSTAPSPDDADQPVDRSAWYALSIFVLIYTCHYLDRSVVGVVAEPIRREFGLSDSQLGLLTGLVYGVAFCIAGIPMGLLIDRFGRKWVLGGLLTAWSGLTSLSGLAQNYTGLILARMGVGAAEAGASPAAMSMIADLFPPSRRAAATSFFFLSSALGTLLSNAVGGAVAAAYGWRTVFFLAGLPGLVLAVILFTTVKEPVRGRYDAPAKAAEPAKAGLRAAVSSVVRDRCLFALISGLVVMAFCAAAKVSFIIPFFMRTHDLSVAQAGMLMAAGAVVFGATGTLAGGAIADRLGKRFPGAPIWLLCVSAALTAVFGVACVVVGDLRVSAVLLMIWFFVGSLWLGPGYAQVSSRSPGQLRGTILAIQLVGSNLVGYGLGPLLTGVLSDMYSGEHSLRWSLATISALYIPAVILFIVAARAGDRQGASPAMAPAAG
jgi:MFS family permease